MTDKAAVVANEPDLCRMCSEPLEAHLCADPKCAMFVTSQQTDADKIEALTKRVAVLEVGIEQVARELDYKAECHPRSALSPFMAEKSLDLAKLQDPTIGQALKGSKS